jgi:outer membrane protein
LKRFQWFIVCACVAGLAPLVAAGQARDSLGPAPVLTLDDALTLARRNNPLFLETLNNRSGANAALRSAYGNWLPSADASFYSQYQQGGRQVFNGGSFGASSDVLQSGYNLSLNWNFNTSTLVTPRLQKANRDAVDADISGAEATLRASVAQQYLTVLQNQARAALQDTLVVAARAQVELARARAGVGAGTQLDVRRAEVALGQQQVQAIRAHNDADVAVLNLFEQLGVSQPANVRLTSTFVVTPLSVGLTDLLDMARRSNPGIQALRSREKVANLNVRRAQGEYSPTLSVRTGWSGYTYQYKDAGFPVSQARAGALARESQCLSQDSIRTRLTSPVPALDCTVFTLTPAQEAAIRSDNNQYPFGFQKSPRSITATLSIPLFDGLSREQRVEEAAASRSDARYSVRARELALTAGVTSAYLSLDAAVKTVTLQEQNAAKAREELTLAQERYRVGAATFLDVTDARASYERAENDRINAVYDYHKAFAALESAVGRPLR